MSNVIDDRAIRTLRYALDGLSLRQRAVANNVANLNTPGYKAVRVSFEGELQRYVERSTTGPRGAASVEPPPVSVTSDASKSMRLDGNSVDLDWEMAQLAETVIKYNTVSELVSLKLSILKNVINSR